MIRVVPVTKLVICERELVVQAGSMINGVLSLTFSVLDKRREHELVSGGSDSIHDRIRVVGRGIEIFFSRGSLLVIVPCSVL